MDNSLIIKFLSGEATTEEKKKLRDWINKSDENRTEFIRFKNIWTISAPNRKFDAFYTDHDLKQIRSKIRSKEESKTRAVYSWLWRAAAVLLIPLSILGTLYFSKHQIKDKSISYNEFITPNRERATVILPDGSKITLNSNSYLRYPDNFSNNSRTVYFEGEALFEVDRDKKKPFIVKTNDLAIEVLGTVFNVSAYPDDETIETTLISGKVSVIPKVLVSSEETAVELNPNQQLVYEKLSQKVNTELVNTDLYTSWIHGEYIFHNEKLEVIMKKIERWYDMEVIINDPGIADQRLSGRFRDEEPLDQVLEVLKLTTPIQYIVKEKVVIIEKK